MKKYPSNRYIYIAELYKFELSPRSACMPNRNTDHTARRLRVLASAISPYRLYITTDLHH